MNRKVEAFDYANEICKAMPRGILLTTKAGDQINTMTIGWGHIGIEWGKPIFVAYVRESRHTKGMLDTSGEFTVNIPLGEFDSKILGYCGTKSGRDTDKIRDLGLTLVESDHVGVPGIAELPLTLECKVIYQQDQHNNTLPAGLYARYYPHTEQFPQGDYHTAYYGEIVGAYIVE